MIFTSLAVIFASACIGVVVHELGHALMARLGGIQIEKFSIGEGPVVLRSRIGETDIVLHAIPWCGFVAPYPTTRPNIIAELGFIFGGVAGNAALVGALFAAWPSVEGHSTWERMLGLAIFVQYLEIASSLVPYRVTIDGRPTGSDGYLALETLRKGAADARPAYVQLVACYDPDSVTAPPAPGAASERLIGHIMRLHETQEGASFRKTLGIIQRERARGAYTAAKEMAALDSVLTNALLSPGLLPLGEMEPLSRRLFELGPAIPAVMGTHGSVLVELGRAAEGQALLAAKRVLPEGDPFDAILTSVFLARAAVQLGDGREAERLLALARTTGPAGVHGPRVDALISATEAQLAALCGTAGAPASAAAPSAIQ